MASTNRPPTPEPDRPDLDALLDAGATDAEIPYQRALEDLARLTGARPGK